MLALEELLMKFEDMQGEMRAMNQRNEKTNEQNTKGLASHKESLRNIEVQLGLLTRDVHEKPQDVITSGAKANHKKNEPCWAVALRSGKDLEPQEDGKLMENNKVKEYLEAQEDENQMLKCNVLEEETSIKEYNREKSSNERPLFKNVVSGKQEST